MDTIQRKGRGSLSLLLASTVAMLGASFANVDLRGGLHGDPVRTDNEARRKQPKRRKLTTADLDRLEAAEAKRKRKAGKLVDQ